MPGRGGAGNILAVQQNNTRIASDLESNEQALKPSSSDLAPQKPDQQYAHSGRGGAGNYSSPKELKEKGTFNDTLPSGLGAASNASNPVTGGSSASAGLIAAVSAPARRIGRGGAGNMSFGVTEDEEKMWKRRQEEEEKREKVKANVEANVNATLAEPPKARTKLPGGKDPF